jgi:putative glutamine amidotransferase
MGGTLHQHLDGHRQDVPPEERTHPIAIYEGSMFHRICGKTEVMVNTFHHQAVKTPAPALTVDAVSPEGYVEAAHEEGHRFLFATQFHPEFYWNREDDDHSAAIFKAFMGACR